MGNTNKISQNFFNQSSSILPICLASDNNYSIPCSVTITSILSNSHKNTNFHFYILDGGISDENKKIILSLKKIKNFQIDFLKMNDKDFNNFFVTPNSHFKIANYYRIKIPTLLPKIDKIIYLDCDVIVKKDLLKLYKTNICKYHLAAVKAQTSEKNKIRMEMPKNSTYINSGVLLINCQKWRQDSIESQLFDFIKNSPPEKLLNVDQDAINAILYSTIKLIPQNWNTEFRVDVIPDKKYQKIIKNPFIIHYLTPDKPWNTDTKQNTDEYFKYLNILNTYLRKNKSPQIDIILPTYNRANKIKIALESIINQTYQKWTLYVVNDGGEDVSEIIKDFKDKRIKYYNIKHIGKSGALNYGLKISNNHYISYMDDDDIIFPQHLELLLTASLQNKRNFVYSDTYLTEIDEKTGKQISQKIENNLDVTYEMLRFQNYINHKQILHTRELYKKVGEYDEKLSILIDWDYIKRLAKIEEPYHVKIITGNHFLYYKNKKINSISGLWTKDPNKVGESLNIIFSKDPESLVKIVKNFYESNNQINNLIQEKEQIKFDSTNQINNLIQEKEQIKLDSTNQINNLIQEKKVLQIENTKLKSDLTKIQSSKSYKLWQKYNKILQKLKLKSKK